MHLTPKVVHTLAFIGFSGLSTAAYADLAAIQAAAAETKKQAEAEAAAAKAAAAAAAATAAEEAKKQAAIAEATKGMTTEQKAAFDANLQRTLDVKEAAKNDAEDAKKAAHEEKIENATGSDEAASSDETSE